MNASSIALHRGGRTRRISKAASRLRRLSLEPLEARQMLSTTYFVDDSLRLDVDDGDPGFSDGDMVTFAAGEAGETNGLLYGTTAFNSIQQGIEAAVDGDTVLVAAGTYQERLEWNSKSIQLIGAGAENTVVDAHASASDPGRGLTIQDVPGTALLEGFTIKGGFIGGNVPVPYTSGGGGVYLVDSSLTLAGNHISGNVADMPLPTPRFWGNGGGVSVSGGSPTLIANTISHNNAASNGGGISVVNASPTLINNVIAANTAQHGGGMRILSHSPDQLPTIFINNTIMSNEVTDSDPSTPAGGGIYFLIYGTATITNSIVWGNTPDDLASRLSFPDPATTLVSYSDIGTATGIIDGGGNISFDPLFVAPADGDYHLQPTSPCIDAGTNDDPNLPGRDKDGAPRVVGAAVDMGAYEVQVASPQDQIQQVLIPQIQSLIDSDTLNGGQGNSFLSKLDGAWDKFDDGNIKAGINKLEAFINEVDAFLNSGKLTQEQGQTLIDAADSAIASALADAERATDAALADAGGEFADGDALFGPLNDSLLDDLLATDAAKGNGKGKK